MPAAAKGTTEAAAKAFVRHYFDTLNYAMNSGNTSQLHAMSADACESCKAIAHNIKKTYDAGGYISTRGWLLQSISTVPGQPPRSPILDLGVLMTGERVTQHEGAEPLTFKGGKQPMTVYLARSRDEWRVSRLDRVA